VKKKEHLSDPVRLQFLRNFVTLNELGLRTYDDASNLPLLTPGPPLAIWISQKLWREGSSRC
jgi:hypothetical protein